MEKKALVNGDVSSLISIIENTITEDISLYEKLGNPNLNDKEKVDLLCKAVQSKVDYSNWSIEDYILSENVELIATLKSMLECDKETLESCLNPKIEIDLRAIKLFKLLDSYNIGFVTE